MFNKLKPKNLGNFELLLAVIASMFLSAVIGVMIAWIAVWIFPSKYILWIGKMTALLIFNIHPIHAYMDESFCRLLNRFERMLDRFKKPRD